MDNGFYIKHNTLTGAINVNKKRICEYTKIANGALYFRRAYCSTCRVRRLKRKLMVTQFMLEVGLSAPPENGKSTASIR